jgi:C_GCAxxG_C_C family probable redox protein
LTTLEVFQEMTLKKDDVLLKATTGLEGGVVASGSTCGVVTGGALGLALAYDDQIREKGASAEAVLLTIVGAYVRWFEQNYKTSLCRERTGVNFYTLSGQIRYLIPDKVIKCLSHISGAVRNLHGTASSLHPVSDSNSYPHAVHCARDVLRGIREQTGTGYPLLERLSVVFDGGLGFQGQICGALAGAIMGINLLLGLDIRKVTYLKTLDVFLFGHIDLLMKKPANKKGTFAVGKEIVKKFKDESGTLECKDITGRTFAGWDDFQGYICTSEKCQRLIKLMIEEVTRIINQ